MSDEELHAHGEAVFLTELHAMTPPQLRAMVLTLRERLYGLAGRVAAQSEILSRRAEKAPAAANHRAERLLDELVTILYLDSLRDEVHRGPACRLLAAAIRAAEAAMKERAVDHLIVAANAAEQSGVLVNASGLRHLADTVRRLE